MTKAALIQQKLKPGAASKGEGRVAQEGGVSRNRRVEKRPASWAPSAKVSVYTRWCVWPGPKLPATKKASRVPLPFHPLNPDRAGIRDPRPPLASRVSLADLPRGGVKCGPPIGTPARIPPSLVARTASVRYARPSRWGKYRLSYSFEGAENRYGAFSLYSWARGGGEPPPTPGARASRGRRSGGTGRARGWGCK